MYDSYRLYLKSGNYIDVREVNPTNLIRSNDPEEWMVAASHTDASPVWFRPCDIEAIETF